MKTYALLFDNILPQEFPAYKEFAQIDLENYVSFIGMCIFFPKTCYIYSSWLICCAVKTQSVVNIAGLRTGGTTMAKGENIFKRKDGRWEARYVKGYQPSGKIKYGFCYGKSYKEAKEKVTKLKVAVTTGSQISTINSKHRFSYFCEEWLKSTKNRVKEATYVKYESILENHIKPMLGSCCIGSLSTAMIEEFSNLLLRQKQLSPKTVRDILSCLRSVIRYVTTHFPGLMPAVDIIYPKETPKEMRVLTPEEQKRLMKYLLENMDACKFGILLALLTGMRIGEICALRWSDINMEDKTIYVHATMQRLKDTDGGKDKKTKIVIGSPKSNKSVRTIPMTEQAFLLCMQMQMKNTTAFVLTGKEQYMEPRTLQYRLKTYTAACNLESVHFHTLRHTFATRAVEVGFEIKTLSEILGHSTTTVTLDRYVHSSLELKRANMDKLNAAGM